MRTRIYSWLVVGATIATCGAASAASVDLALLSNAALITGTVLLSVLTFGAATALTAATVLSLGLHFGAMAIVFDGQHNGGAGAGNPAGSAQSTAQYSAKLTVKLNQSLPDRTPPGWPAADSPPATVSVSVGGVYKLANGVVVANGETGDALLARIGNDPTITALVCGPASPSLPVRISGAKVFPGKGVHFICGRASEYCTAWTIVAPGVGGSICSGGFGVAAGAVALPPVKSEGDPCFGVTFGEADWQCRFQTPGPDPSSPLADQFSFYESWTIPVTADQCPQGYSLVGVACALTNASLVKRPADGQRDMEFNAVQQRWMNTKRESEVSSNTYVSADGKTLRIVGQNSTIDFVKNPDGTTVVRYEPQDTTTVLRREFTVDNSGVVTATQPATTASGGAPGAGSFAPTDGAYGSTITPGATQTPNTNPGTGSGGSGASVGSSTGTGTGSGSGTGTGSGAGTRTTAQCGVPGQPPCEVNFGGQVPGPGDPVPRSGADISSAMTSNAFTSLIAWQLPAHSSTCPTAQFTAFATAFAIDKHCDVAETLRNTISVTMLLSFALLALFTVLRA